MFFAFVVSSFYTLAQNDSPNSNYIITKRMISIEDGLSSRMVYDAIQDHDGFMWFATANGLCRYDGNSFKTYNTKNSPLISNTVTRLAIDAKNHLFIQSVLNPGSIYIDEQIQVLDLHTYQFINLNQALPNTPFKAEQFNCIIHDESGSIYFLTDKRSKLWQYSTNSTFKLRADFHKTLASFISSTSTIKSGNECVLIRTYEINQSICIYPDTIILTDNNKLIPVAINEKREFILYNQKSNTFFAMDFSGKKNGINFTSTTNKINASNFVLSNFDSHSLLFKSEQNQYYLNRNNQFIEIYNSNDRFNIKDFGVSNYFKDNKDNYWFCSEKGVYQVNIRQHQFEHIFSNNRINQMINRAARSIYVDYNPMGKKRIFAMINYELTEKEKEEKVIKNNSGLVITKKDDWIYIASGSSLIKYNLKNGQSKKTITSLNIGESWSIANFSDSLTIIGGSSGIITLNTNTGVSNFISYSGNKFPPPVYVYRIIKTKFKGWIAVAENGIYFINEKGAVYDYYGKMQPQADKRFPFSGIFDFYEDKEGIVWLAMNGEGLIRWNWNSTHPMASENFKKFTTANGLSDDILNRIEEDNKNNLWISSYNGLVKFNKKNYSTKIYRTKDGLSNSEFNRISSFKDKDGWLYFGGQNGIDAFDPAKMNIEANEKSISFKLVQLSSFSSSKNKQVDLKHELSVKNEIIMNPDDISLSISFSLLDFQNRTHLYAYKIDGLDRDWNYINENRILISRLPYGQSRIYIKAQLESGNWNAQEIIIPVTVLKPFYLKNWFLVSLLILISGIIYTVFLFRARKFEKDKIKLEEKVKQRTESLNTVLSQKEILLTEIHHRVKNNLQVISGLLELRKTGIEDEKSLGAFNESQSGIMSIALIHELLYQNENVGELEFNFILNNIISNVAQLFGKQDKKINFKVVPNDFVFNMDTSVTLGLIMNELLTNAFKYLPSNQKNNVTIEITKKNSDYYNLIFHDNGPGLKSEVDFEEPSTTGFSMIKSLVMQLHGTIKYEYNNGSKFDIGFMERRA